MHCLAISSVYAIFTFINKVNIKSLNILAVLKNLCLILLFKKLHTLSIGLNSGEYGGKNSNVILFCSQYS